MLSITKIWQNFEKSCFCLFFDMIILASSTSSRLLPWEDAIIYNLYPIDKFSASYDLFKLETLKFTSQGKFLVWILRLCSPSVLRHIPAKCWRFADVSKFSAHCETKKFLSPDVAEPILQQKIINWNSYVICFEVMGFLSRTFPVIHNLANWEKRLVKGISISFPWKL